MEKKNKVYLNSDQDKMYKDLISKELTERIDNSIVNEQKGLLYATFGYHSEEPPNSIIHRKLREVQLYNYGLWGCGVKEGKKDEHLIRIRNFCEKYKDENGNVFLFLQFTRSTNLDDKEKISTKVWTPEELRKDNCFSKYIDDQGNEFNVEEKNIIVKGDEKEQHTAFYVTRYYLYERSFEKQLFLNSYHACNYYSKEDKNINLFNQCPCYLLNKKTDLTDKPGENWAIVLQLKWPYIVKMC